MTLNQKKLYSKISLFFEKEIGEGGVVIYSVNSTNFANFIDKIHPKYGEKKTFL